MVNVTIARVPVAEVAREFLQKLRYFCQNYLNETTDFKILSKSITHHRACNVSSLSCNSAYINLKFKKIFRLFICMYSPFNAIDQSAHY